jgi:hypothetical protein
LEKGKRKVTDDERDATQWEKHVPTLLGVNDGIRRAKYRRGPQERAYIKLLQPLCNTLGVHAKWYYELSQSKRIHMWASQLRAVSTQMWTKKELTIFGEARFMTVYEYWYVL